MSKPVPTTDFIQSYKTGQLSSSLSKEDIDRILGFEGNQEESGDGKSTVVWDFRVDGVDCSIWDYKGSRWSTFGPSSIFQELFGDQYTVYSVGRF